MNHSVRCRWSRPNFVKDSVKDMRVGTKRTRVEVGTDTPDPYRTPPDKDDPTLMDLLCRYPSQERSRGLVSFHTLVLTVTFPYTFSNDLLLTYLLATSTRSVFYLLKMGVQRES